MSPWIMMLVGGILLSLAVVAWPRGSRPAPPERPADRLVITWDGSANGYALTHWSYDPTGLDVIERCWEARTVRVYPTLAEAEAGRERYVRHQNAGAL